MSKNNSSKNSTYWILNFIYWILFLVAVIGIPTAIICSFQYFTSTGFATPTETLTIKTDKIVSGCDSASKTCGGRYNVFTDNENFELNNLNLYLQISKSKMCNITVSGKKSDVYDSYTRRVLYRKITKINFCE